MPHNSICEALEDLYAEGYVRGTRGLYKGNKSYIEMDTIGSYFPVKKEISRVTVCFYVSL